MPPLDGPDMMVFLIFLINTSETSFHTLFETTDLFKERIIPQDFTNLQGTNYCPFSQTKFICTLIGSNGDDKYFLIFKTRIF